MGVSTIIQRCAEDAPLTTGTRNPLPIASMPWEIRVFPGTHGVKNNKTESSLCSLPIPLGITKNKKRGGPRREQAGRRLGSLP